ncbi:Tn3 family transposase [Streptomyces sp. 8N616]|uniref:Tn3 family transposase n=1 Tax=Streptomyces sp. 8N616 TaxID=3457414 RepID=UPI003FD1E008
MHSCQGVVSHTQLPWAASSSATPLKRLRSGSHKNATYTAFREVGRVIRTVQLLRYLTDAPMRQRVTAATNKVESFNRFSQWVGSGNQGVIADNDPVEQEKAMKFNALLTNAVIFHNALDIAEIVRQMLEEGWEIAAEDLAHVSPYLTEHIKRFGEYSTHELGIEPEAYDPKLDVDFTPLAEQDLATADCGQAARIAEPPSPAPGAVAGERRRAGVRRVSPRLHVLARGGAPQRGER